MGNVVKLLITGAGAPGFYGIYSCLNKEIDLELWCCDANSDASGRSFCMNFFQVPKAFEANYIQVLLEKCKANNIKFILPLVTDELEVLALNRTDFLVHDIKILNNTSDVLSKVNNKCALYQTLSRLGFDVPESKYVQSYDDIERAAVSLGYPGNRLIMKPCRANGSRGFRIISQSEDQLKLLFNEKPGSAPISLQELLNLLHGKSFPAFMISEFLPGKEYSVDMICSDGQTLLCVPRLRSKMNNGISVAGTIEHHQEIIRYCTSIALALNLNGFNGIQVKAASDGTFKILEINPRLQGTTSAVRLAGVNIPLEGIRHFVFGKPFNSGVAQQIKWGTDFFRVYEDMSMK